MSAETDEAAKYITEDQHFIYEKYEVQLTGRKGVRRGKSEDSIKTDTIYEIKAMNGVDWTGWCRLRDLHKIETFI